VWDFNVLPLNLEAMAGVPSVVGGVLRATLGDWGPNLPSNGEFTTDTAGWTIQGGRTLARVDSSVDPGVASGGADVWCGKTVAATVAIGSVYAPPVGVAAGVVGAFYRAAMLFYVPNTNSALNVIQLRVYNSIPLEAMSGVSPPAFDVWSWLETSSVSPLAGTGEITIRVRFAGIVGDTACFDKVELYRQNSVLRILDWDDPSGRFTLDMPVPAAGVVPFSWLTRIQDALNYYEVRVTPNTGGLDTRLYQVVAGVETPLVEVDVDWTAGGADKMRVISEGNGIIVDVKKATDTGWSTKMIYDDANLFLDAPFHGPMLWDSAVGRLARITAEGV
jgi:hypothetical protein